MSEKIEVLVAQIATDVKYMSKTLDKHLEDFEKWKRDVDTHIGGINMKKAEIRGAWGTICMFSVAVGTVITMLWEKIKVLVVPQ